MITILPARLKLLHFPRSHLAHVTHAIAKACFFEDIKKYNNCCHYSTGLAQSNYLPYSPDYFFSFTENSYEISIAANVSIIDNDLLPFLTSCPDIGTSPDVFRVLQVDDAGGQGKPWEGLTSCAWGTGPTHSHTHFALN